MKTIFANLTKLFANKHFWQRLLILLALSPLWVPLLISLVWAVFGESEQERIAKYQATLPPDNGKIIEVDGEKFRIVYIGGVKFKFPVSNHFGWIGWRSSGPSGDIEYISLYWPDIPPGKVPGTKYKALVGQVGKTNAVEVLVYGTENPIEIDQTKEPGFHHRVSTSSYISRDDLKLGLRIISLKEHPDSWSYAYSLTDDAVEPWGGQPVVLSGDRIYFSYAPRIEVRMAMMGWGTIDDEINPNWKGIYLGVVETLNQYREDKP